MSILLISLTHFSHFFNPLKLCLWMFIAGHLFCYNHVVCISYLNLAQREPIL